MSDNPQKKRPQDSSRINVHEDYELRYWSEHLGVSPAQLKEAVEKVGVSADDVRRHLQK